MGLTNKLEDNFYHLLASSFYHYRRCYFFLGQNTSSLSEHLIGPDLPVTEHVPTNGLKLSDITIEGAAAHLL